MLMTAVSSFLSHATGMKKIEAACIYVAHSIYTKTYVNEDAAKTKRKRTNSECRKRRP
jgi:hypothetical protein